MNMGIQDQCLGRESPTCLFPGPRFLEITFYQLLRTIPPANLSHRGTTGRPQTGRTKEKASCRPHSVGRIGFLLAQG
ncbi:hypothetical protein ILYODFUR_025199 [Ilyodon furcidens]|uniref:Uncharacterized protein n=1 Tax=Ilyodon furcidens TaxID=33524 RepID=A0ABV0UWE4_9TELE